MPKTRVLLAVLALAGGSALTIATPASAADAGYVALGDSYSSGVGTGSFLNDGTDCQRSVYSYPSLIAAASGLALNLRACSGARVADVAAGQLDALNTDTRYVSLSVGGNDAGFADVLTECAKPGWMSDCNAAIDGSQAVITGALPGRLADLYGQIRARAPQATVVVVGYPHIFNGEDCNAGTWFSPTEESRLNGTADMLDGTIATTAGAAGFAVVDPTSSFLGHAVCDSPEWLNGLSWPITESYHPNRAGHSASYLPLVAPELTGDVVTADEKVMAGAAASAGALAAQQRRYTDRDAGIQPERFVVPDLDSPAARAAAAKAGVDLASRVSIDTVDAAFSVAQAKAAGVLGELKQAAGTVAQRAVATGARAGETVRSWGRRAWSVFGG